MTEFWKYYNGYKFYTEDKSILGLLKQITGAVPHTSYTKNGVLIAEDIIIPEKMLGRAKRISGENLRYIE